MFAGAELVNYPRSFRILSLSLSLYVLLRVVVTVVEYRVGGRAIREQRPQMTRREMMTTARVVLALRGFMTARLLSRVMASIVKTLADTVERDMNWFRQQ